MKSIPVIVALVACLGGPALAEELSSTPPSGTPAADGLPAAQAALPAVLTRSTAPAATPSALPAATPPDTAAARGPAGGGCHHGQETVYLTN